MKDIKESFLNVLKEQKEAEKAKEKLDIIPWFQDFILDAGSSLANSSVEMDVQMVEDDYLKVIFTGEPQHLLALTDSLLKHAKPMPKIMRKKSDEGFFSNDLIIVIDLFDYKL
jgi:hypothetical protein